MAGTRILQILGDTDADRANADALELHATLSAHGAEVRTLALAPGRTGGLETTVPTIAPSRHGFAARSGFAGERRWADMVLLNGQRSLVLATWPASNGPPVVVHLDSSADLTKVSTVSVRAMVARRASIVAVAPRLEPAELAARWKLNPGRVRSVGTATDWLGLVSECTG